MAGDWSKSDLELFSILGEYRTLTVLQLSLLTGRNLKALRRRLSQLKRQGVVEFLVRGYGRGRGRPENVIRLTRQGIASLSKMNGISSEAAQENFAEIPPN